MLCQNMAGLSSGNMPGPRISRQSFPDTRE
nr:MAG TPA: hypothetical protein [Caudoviricetes sp.]